MPTPADLRANVASLSTLAAHDLRGLWSSVKTADAARNALEDILPKLSVTYRLASASMAADWYDDHRDLLGVRGRFSALVPDIDDAGADVLARWGVGPLYSDKPDWESAQTLIEGGLQRRIADASRDTIRESSIEDPRARGWQRETSGGCEFCEMVAARGVVFSEASADFASHDHCQCIAVPAFDGEPKPVKAYTPSERDISDADRARVRDYLRSHRTAG